MSISLSALNRYRNYVAVYRMDPGPRNLEIFSDGRLRYFWDGRRLTGEEWQKVLGTRRVAWDVYLLYGRASRWDNDPVSPDFWMHQLNDESRAPRLDEAVFEKKAGELLGRK